MIELYFIGYYLFGLIVTVLMVLLPTGEIKVGDLFAIILLSFVWPLGLVMFGLMHFVSWFQDYEIGKIVLIKRKKGE